MLARKAGWHDQAASIALSAAASPLLDGTDPRLAAERGLLIQSAAYTAARAGERDAMRELTGQASAIAAGLGTAVLLRDHGGGFTPATVGLHKISAENYAGDPGAAVAAAARIDPASLPTTERRARSWTDTARDYANWGRREDCVSALLAAEREASEETHARPAVRDLVSGLLVSGRAGPELRGLAGRCGTLNTSRSTAPDSSTAGSGRPEPLAAASAAGWRGSTRAAGAGERARRRSRRCALQGAGSMACKRLARHANGARRPSPARYDEAHPGRR